MLESDSRPKLLGNSIFFQTRDGVFLQGGDSAFSLRGPSVYGWLASLSGRLDGESTLDEICRGLDDDRRQIVFKLVNTLLDRGLVRDQPAEDPGLLDPVVRRQFRTQIEFIDHHGGGAQARFAAFRESRILVAGAGASLVFLSRALLRNGLRRLEVASDADHPVDLRVVRGEVEHLRAEGLDAELNLIVGAPSAELAAGRHDAVVYCSDAPNLAAVRELSRRCTQIGCRFLPALSLPGRTFVGPLVEAGQLGCWMCAMLRLADASSDRLRADLWRGLCLGTALPAGPALGGPAARILGNSAAFALFKLLAGQQPTELVGQVLVQTVETLESYLAPLQPHPGCPDCAGAAESGSDAPQPTGTDGSVADELSAAELLDQARSLLDPNFGLFQRFDDQELPQLPLKATVLPQGGGADGDRPRQLVGFSTENVLEARVAVLREALAAYFSATPQPRRFLRASLVDLLGEGRDPLPSEHLACWRGGLSFAADEAVEWLPARSLSSGAMRTVPAAAVHPALDRLGLFERPPRQVAVATALGELEHEALVAALGAEIIDRAMANPDLERIDPDGLEPLHPDLGFLVQSCRRFEGDLLIAALRDLSPVSVVVVAARSGGDEIVRYGVGTSRAFAARAALIELVGAIQWRSSGRSAPVLPDERWAELAPAVAAAFAAEKAVEKGVLTAAESGRRDLLDFLQADGRDALFLDVTSPDVRRTVTLTGGMVLLTTNPVRRP